MRIAALDLSLRASGVALNYPGDVVSSFTIAPGARTGAERLFFLQKAIDQATTGADLVLREGYAFGAKGNAQYDLGELGGCVRVLLYCRKRPLLVVPPSVIKKLATGDGNAKKEAVLVAAVKRLGYQGTDHNQADALWLLQAALQFYQLPGAVELPKKHLDALSRVKWPTITELVPA